jgi:hypothetical protein
MKDGMGFCRGTLIAIPDGKSVDIERLYDNDIVVDAETCEPVKLLRVKFMDVPVFYRLYLQEGVVLVCGGSQSIFTVRGQLPAREVLNGEPLQMASNLNHREWTMTHKEKVFATIRMYKLVLASNGCFLANGVKVK